MASVEKVWTWSKNQLLEFLAPLKHLPAWSWICIGDRFHLWCLQMLIKGIRSFSPDNQNVIDFHKPLTLIVGQNGAGKTVLSSSADPFPAFPSVICSWLSSVACCRLIWVYSLSFMINCFLICALGQNLPWLFRFWFGVLNSWSRWQTSALLVDNHRMLEDGLLWVFASKHSIWAEFHSWSEGRMRVPPAQVRQDAK